MSGMDRLSDADVEWHASHGAPLSAAMARELLAHRRASQAAPAPIYHGDLSILPDTEDKFRDMVCATAPSDGLREALADALDLLKSFGLNDSVAYRNGIAALTPAPAQEVKP